MSGFKTAGEASPLVSIIIPCYNQAHFLSEAIESVLAQTYPHSEIIVVDDGSLDNTVEVATRYPHVRCIRQDNQGLPAAARNTGLRESKGDYVVFLDADDRLLPRALETGLECLQAHPECAFVFGNCRCIAFDGSTLPGWEQSPSVETEHYKALLQGCYIWTPATVMFQRAVAGPLMSFNTSINIKGTEDYDLYLRIAREFPILCHKQVIVEYRQHSTSVSRDSARMLQNVLHVIHSQWKHVKGNKPYEQAYRVGIKSSRDYYSDQLVNEMRTHLQARAGWKHVMRAVPVLLRYSPYTLPILATRRVLRYLRTAE